MRWLSAAGKKILDGRRSDRGINHVAVDEAVVGAATTRWTTAPKKRGDAMKGSWSNDVDERRPSLAVDDGVGVAAPARWRMGWRTEEAGRIEEVVVPPMVYEWGNGGEGGSQTLGRRWMGWRTAADGGGWGGEGVLAPTEYEWGKGR